MHDVVGQVRRQVRDLVGVELLGRGDQFLRLHVRDEGLAHRLGQLQQDLAFAVGLDQIPYAQAPVERQGLEDVSDISRVQCGEPALQLGHVLLVQQRLDQLLARPSLLVDQVLHEPLLIEQLQDLVQRVLHALVGFGMFDFSGHGSSGTRARTASALEITPQFYALREGSVTRASQGPGFDPAPRLELICPTGCRRQLALCPR